MLPVPASYPVLTLSHHLTGPPRTPPRPCRPHRLAPTTRVPSWWSCRATGRCSWSGCSGSAGRSTPRCRAGWGPGASRVGWGGLGCRRFQAQQPCVAWRCQLFPLALARFACVAYIPLDAAAFRRPRKPTTLHPAAPSPRPAHPPAARGAPRPSRGGGPAPHPPAGRRAVGPPHRSADQPPGDLPGPGGGAGAEAHGAAHQGRGGGAQVGARVPSCGQFRFQEWIPACRCCLVLCLAFSCQGVPSGASNHKYAKRCTAPFASCVAISCTVTALPRSCCLSLPLPYALPCFLFVGASGSGGCAQHALPAP